MSKIFLETSALIELSFGNKATVAKIESLVPQGSENITSQYVIFELQRGFLNYLVLTHNKAKQLTKFSELIRYTGNLRFRPNHAGAVIGFLERYFEANHPALTNEQRLVHCRGFLRREIRRGYDRVTAILGQIINEIGCRNTNPPAEDDSGIIQFDPKQRLCGINAACGLKAYAATWKDDLARIREHLKGLPSIDSETQARIKGLRELYRHPTLDFDKGSCYRSGDALIVHEAAADSEVVTKNKKHLEPVCNCLGKLGIYY